MTTEQFFDAFISYARSDGKAFATKLCQHLADHNLKVWFDQNDIPPAVDWRHQIRDSIERANNLLFIITPYSIESAYCREELETAYNLNKRIIPVLYIRVPRENRPESIRKLNWIYFRDEVDEWERSFEQLLSALHQERDYVEQHTHLYIQALTWSRNQKQNSYLLVGQERSSAEAWLKRQFTDSQPPCRPTELHCEFISESRKNANNLMADVFLSYASEDREVMEQVRRILFRQGFTIWTDKTDINSGTQFQTEIHKGIEGADNLVYFLSHAAVHSQYCQQELTYARSLHKRIVPLRLETVDAASLPTELEGLQYINLPPLGDLEQFQAQSNLLLKALNQDAYYHQQHKVLLVKALKWKEQKQNPSILLRGHNLNHFRDWLDLAKTRHDYPPVPLQTEYINASEQQPVQPALDVFISYSRSDSDFVRKLNDALQIQGKTTWFDQESIPSGSDYQQELYRGIQGCDNFLFLISPQSIHSPYCDDEVDFAVGQQKRIVTVVYQSVPAEDLHPALAKVQWIDFNNYDGDFYANFSELVRTLETDREHVRQHTLWSLRAKEWADKDKGSDLLVRGSEFALAEQWLLTAEKERKLPPVTERQKEFISASAKAIAAAARREKRRLWILRGLLGLVSSALVVASGLGIYAYREYRRATIHDLQSLSQYSNALFVLGNRLDALIVAIRAKKIKQQLGKVDPDTQNQIDSALTLAVLKQDELNRLWGHNGSVYTVAFSPDGKLIASGATDNTIKLWDMRGKLQRTFKGHGGVVTRIAFSPDGQTIASASEDGTVKLWDLEGTLQITLEEHGYAVWDVTFSPDGERIASAGEDNTVKLWRRDGHLQTTLTGHAGPVWGIAFSPNNQTLASASADGTVKLWNPDGSLRTTFKGHGDEVWCVTFSPDGQMLASAGEDNTILLWDLDGTPRHTLRGHGDAVSRIAFSPNGRTLVSASWDNTVKLWSRDGTLLESFGAHTDDVNDVAFSPDGQTIASGSSDNTIRLWRHENSWIAVLRGHRREVESVAFSPEVKRVASGGRGNIVRLWDLDGNLKAILKGHSDRVTDVEFSPDGQTIASASTDNTVRLWTETGQLRRILRGHQKRVSSVEFSPDGQTIASAGADNTVKLWNLNGTLRTTLRGHEGAVSTVAFSPNGETLVSGGWDSKIKLWSIQGALLRTITGHDGAITSVAFSPDGETIASGSEDNTVKLWTLDGTLRTTLRGHSEEVRSVTFSSDGNLLATAGSDLRLWSRDGTLLASVNLYAPVRYVDFAPKGQSMAFAYLNQVFLVRDVEQLTDIDRLLAYGCDWLKDYLRTSPKLTQGDRQLCDGIGR